MKDMPHIRRFVLISCLVVMLLAALTLAGGALPFAFLVPMWFFFAAVISLSARTIEEHRTIQLFLVLPVFSPRPPPVR
jgi:hypothetical protein